MWGFGSAWGLARKVERLLALEAVHGEAIDGLKQAVADIEKRLTRLETLEGVTVSEARAAARAGAQDLVGIHLMEIGRRLGALEGSGSQPRRIEP